MPIYLGKNKIPDVNVVMTSSSTNKIAKAVNFRDYDGTVLHSYTVEEAAALTELPELPTHAGLICQGWNWSLADIKAMESAVEVGAMYITDDGKTRIYIHLEEGRTSPMLGCCPNGTVTVDWGDGTTPDTLTGTSTSTIIYTPVHEYTVAGDYIISLTVDGEAAFVGGEYLSFVLSTIIKQATNLYSCTIRKVELGSDVAIGASAFNSCYRLASITIPNNVGAIRCKAFYRCTSLGAVIIPSSVTVISSQAFAECGALEVASIPSNNDIFCEPVGGNLMACSYMFQHCFSLGTITLGNIGSLSNNAFEGCWGLTSVVLSKNITDLGYTTFKSCISVASFVIPGNVTQIGSAVFATCSGVRFYDFSAATSVPSLDANAFANIADDCEIRVPIALYTTWKNSANWSAYADHIPYLGTPCYVNISNNEGGTVSPSGQVLVPPSENVSLKIIPDETHTLSDITLDGVSVKADAVYADNSGKSYDISAVDGATYGFALNSDGYYESNNQAQKNSAALCKITFNLAAETEVTIDAITYGESSYDYGLLGAVDQVLTTTNTADSGVFWNGKGKSSASPYQVTYTIPAGEHFIYAKYIKDSSGNNNKDSLQFKVNLDTTSYYTYAINNVQADHTVVVTFEDKA